MLKMTNPILEEFLGKIISYFETKKKILGYKLIDRLSLFLGFMVTVFILLLCIMFGVFFIGLALAGFINEKTNTEFIGHLVVSTLYIIAIIAMFQKINSKGMPLFVNTFVRVLVTIFEDEERN